MDVVKVFEGHDVHIIVENDTPYFRASHVAIVLGISNIRDALYGITKKRNHDQDEDMTKYRVSLQTSTAGGSQEVTYLTEDGLYHIMWRSKKEMAIQFRQWVCDVLREIRQHGKYELQTRIQELEGNVNVLTDRLRPTTTFLYAFKTDRKQPDEECYVKLGSTEAPDVRQIPYLQVAPNGVQVAAAALPKKYVSVAEKKIMFQLMNMTETHVKGEVYYTNVEEAKMTVQLVADLVNLYSSTSSEGVLQRQKVLRRIVAVLNEDLRDAPVTSQEPLTTTELQAVKEALHELKHIKASSVSTDHGNDMDEDVSVEGQNSCPSHGSYDFDRYVSECCDVAEALRDDAATLVGRHRVWAKETNRELQSAFYKYLKKRFVPVKFVIDGKAHHGYEGVKVRAQEFEVSVVPTQAERFLQDVCTHAPASRLYFFEVRKAFSEWRQQQEELYVIDEAELREVFKYLDGHFLKSVLWIPQERRSENGYYGVCLKGFENKFFRKMASRTAVEIVAKDPVTGVVQHEWKRVADAAAALGLSTAGISYSIRTKKLRQGCVLGYKNSPE